MSKSAWPVFKIKKDGTANTHHEDVDKLPSPPPWRDFSKKATQAGSSEPPPFLFTEEEAELINTALFLRRPLLVEGRPGYGKSSIIRAVAHQLNLGEVLYWPINTRSTLKEGLYHYDAIARLQDTSLPEHQAQVRDIGRYLELGPLGTALAPTPSRRPRALLIDEIDKSDIDLPNDLLNVFETGSFDIPELIRLGEEDEKGSAVKVRCQGSQKKVSIQGGHIQCTTFPFVVMTSNGERSFSAPFLRRCVRLEVRERTKEELREIVKMHLGECDEELLHLFDEQRTLKKLANDQLLNAVYLRLRGKVHDLDAIERATFNPLEDG